MTRTPTAPDLFRSAAGMADATNYNDWTFSLVAPYVRGAVLEVGCGVGTFTRRLLAAGSCDRLVGIDVSERAVAHCRASLAGARVDLRCIDVRSIGGRFDLIVCMNVLEHIEDDAAALEHMIGLLAPGGTLFLLVPAHQALYSDFDREAGHYRRYSKASLLALLRRVPATAACAVRQFYFNSVGALGYFMIYRAFRKAARDDASGEIGLFDRRIVPLLRRVEGPRVPFGISLVSVITTPA